MQIGHKLKGLREAKQFSQGLIEERTVADFELGMVPAIYGMADFLGTAENAMAAGP
jgi:hypothetical protein